MKDPGHEEDSSSDQFDRKKVKGCGKDKNEEKKTDHDEESSGFTDHYDTKSLRRDGKEKGKERKKGRSSEPVRNRFRESGRLGEDEVGDENYEDQGREESNEFLELNNLERKKKKSAERAKALFMENFVGSVERDAEGFKKSAAELEKEWMIEQNKFITSFHATYAFASPFRIEKKGAKHENDIHDFALNHGRGKDMIARALEIISQFDKLARKNVTKEFEGLLGNEWGKEDDQIAKMLELGKTVGLNKFECIINASKPEETLDTDAIEVSNQIFPVVEEGNSIGWGKEAKKHQRANRKLLKAFESKV
ncbi:5978faae-785d-43ae-a92e-b84755461d88 [Sclerotinia trifoliorum]|uniref:5978faae-785d-43ae-a92e-b84755461d88 n=1 Tax=Sclerotinia trifoliorum TaxID=28548 RepID=A0A8H2VPY2_9HELO|nr:5978faae-785d-43ae-a92e-b84755461d88 [Sclerotinia trifoliorum]